MIGLTMLQWIKLLEETCSLATSLRNQCIRTVQQSCLHVCANLYIGASLGGVIVVLCSLLLALC